METWKHPDRMHFGTFEQATQLLEQSCVEDDQERDLVVKPNVP